SQMFAGPADVTTDPARRTTANGESDVTAPQMTLPAGPDDVTSCQAPFSKCNNRRTESGGKLTPLKSTHTPIEPENCAVVVRLKYFGGSPSAKDAGMTGPLVDVVSVVTPAAVTLSNVKVTGVVPSMVSSGLTTTLVPTGVGTAAKRL